MQNIVISIDSQTLKIFFFVRIKHERNGHLDIRTMGMEIKMPKGQLFTNRMAIS